MVNRRRVRVALDLLQDWSLALAASIKAYIYIRTWPMPLPPKAAWPMLGGHSLAARRVALRISDSGRWWQTPRLQLGDRPMPPKTAAASWSIAGGSEWLLIYYRIGR